MNNPNNKLSIRPLIFTALLTALLMTSFEIIKQLIHENITIWESHLITISLPSHQLLLHILH